MNGQQLLDSIYTVYRGKIQSKTPVFGSDKANIAINIANRKKNEWANDTNQAWVSLYKTIAPNEVGTVSTTGTTTLTGVGTYFTDYNVGDKITVSGETVRTIATITSNTSLEVTVDFSNTASSLTFTRTIILKTGVNSYNLHRSFISPARNVIVTTTTQSIKLNIASPQAQSAECYIHGLNPKVITFVDTVPDYMVGGTLSVPANFKPDDITAATDLVSVDNPEWLVYIVASELSRNDPAKDDQFPNLVAMANDLYAKMALANRNIGFLNGNTIYNAMPQISYDLDEDWTL